MVKNAILKSHLDNLVSDLQTDILLLRDHKKRLTDEDKINLTIYIKMISNINKEFGTTYKNAAIYYSSKDFKRFPLETKKGYLKFPRKDK